MSAHKKPVIPVGHDPAALAAIKANLDIITGRMGGELPVLAESATLADCVAAINSVIARLNAST